SGEVRVLVDAPAALVGCAGPAFDADAAQRTLAELVVLVGVDPAATLERATVVQAGAAQAGDGDLALTARVLVADALQRMGRTSEAARAVRELRAGPQELPAEHQVRTAWVLMRVFSSLGDSATALDHALDALPHLGGDVSPRLQAQFLIKMADVLGAVGDVEGARERYAQAELLAVGDPELHVRAVNNSAFGELMEGNTAQAVADAERLVALAAHYGAELNSDELDTVAHIHLLQGRPDQAVEAALQALEVLERKDNKAGDDLPDILLTLATARRHTGDLDEAARCIVRARRISTDHGYGDITARLLEEEAEVLAGKGDFRGAFAAHQAFHAADKELVSLRRQEQSRARQAMYESTQARADAARFREEARRDPLTGLHNRLAVGERLPALLDARRRGGLPVVAALFDLDHFKAVNDGYSHEVGDQVLVTFAELLAGGLADLPEGAGLAARLGGEEFLLVLAATTVERATARVEAVRRAVEEHDWSAVTPGRSITVSAGIALADDDATQFSLLRQADVELYAAKAGGRNRVCGA
ncbi:diguanylate cyclase, partial [Kineococcus sp. R8]|uniref:GGDEF domain-containing protein n=1 Tax=Kineococcus siccus TaxID=2696567 RepID=UPI00141282D5